MNEINFHTSSPILRVSSLAESVDYYVEKLGFKLDWQYEGVMASVSRKAANLMLSENDQGGGGAWVYIGVGSADELFAELKAKGVQVELPPTNFAWGKEIHISDADGNVLRFGSEPDAGAPTADWVFWYRRKT